MRRFSVPSQLFLALIALMVATAVLAEISVVIGYDTRAEGEIDPCG
ncbi:hypothetical protein H8E52_00775 [bacterium]|nr:hypothetical protein [bacterium]